MRVVITVRVDDLVGTIHRSVERTGAVEVDGASLREVNWNTIGFRLVNETLDEFEAGLNTETPEEEAGMPKQKATILEDLFGREFFDLICEWVGANTEPEHVHNFEVLDGWAIDNGYIRHETPETGLGREP